MSKEKEINKEQKKILDFATNELKKILDKVKDGKQVTMSSDLRKLKMALEALTLKEKPTEEKIDEWAKNFSKNLKDEGDK